MGAGKTAALVMVVLAVALWIVLDDDAAEPRDAAPLMPGAPAEVAAPTLPEPVEREPAARAEPTALAAQPERLAQPAQEVPREFLTVEVVSKDDGTPIEGAAVRAVLGSFGDDSMSVAASGVSDAAGRCELAPPTGSLWLTASVPGKWYGYTDHLHLGVQAPEVVRVEVYELVEISGRVTDPAGAPLEGVRVSSMVSKALRTGAATTDADGHFAFGGMKLNVGHALDFERDGYGDASRHLIVGTDGAWRIIDHGLDGDRLPAPVFLEIVMSPERVILGRVVDGERRGVPDIEVRASGMVWTEMFGSPDEHATRTEDDGSFDLRGTRVDVGYLVRADIPELGVAMQYAFPGETRVDLGVLPLREFATLSGRFVDADGRPAAGPFLELELTRLGEFDASLAEVELGYEPARELGRAHVGPDGRFEIVAPCLAALDLVVRLGSRIVQRHAPDLSSGSLDMGDLALDRASTLLEGRLLDVDGAPLAGRRLELGTSAHRRLAVLETDASGAFSARVFLPHPERVHLELAAEPGWLPGVWDLSPDELPFTLTALRAGDPRPASAGEVR